MAISPQRLTIYLYSAHRAVIFAIAQLSCIRLGLIWQFIYLVFADSALLALAALNLSGPTPPH